VGHPPGLSAVFKIKAAIEAAQDGDVQRDQEVFLDVFVFSGLVRRKQPASDLWRVDHMGTWLCS